MKIPEMTFMEAKMRLTWTLFLATGLFLLGCKNPVVDKPVVIEPVNPAQGSAAIHVSLEGSDEGTGTRDDPVRSLRFALDLALLKGFGEVRVAHGSYYTQALEIPDGISLRGAYDPDSWTKAVGQTTVIHVLPQVGDTFGIKVKDLMSKVVLEDMEVQVSDATSLGASSYGVLVQNAGEWLEMRRVVIRVGAGAPGDDGLAGADGAPGGAGQGGQPGHGDDDNVMGFGGAGGEGAIPGATGGLGGHKEIAYKGQSGSSVDLASGTAITGGKGGNAGNPGNPGAHGLKGPDGPQGLAGAHALDSGSVIGGYWVPSVGEAGQDGYPGTGGSGGGGGGGQSSFLSDNGPGNGGGGGGGGGYAGTGGSGGRSGGGSFGILVYDTVLLRLEDVTVFTSSGGKGGIGGSGGLGGSGGSGGSGADAFPAEIGRGGNGGNGGNGGAGGPGGAGAGGPSYGLVLLNSTVSTLDLVISPGEGGAPGNEAGTSGPSTEVIEI